MLSKLFGRGQDEPQSKRVAPDDNGSPVVRTTARMPLRIRNPVVGFVCVTPEHQALMEADKAAIGSLFSDCRSSTSAIVSCNVLFLYCKIDESGGLPGLQMRVRDFVKAAGAHIAICGIRKRRVALCTSSQPQERMARQHCARC